jgi:2-C-methyl-D-erythritol 4-phosphate cytidylyltransferase
MSASALIVAAGQGARFASQTAKQYHSLAGLTVLEHTTQKIAQSHAWQQLIIVLPSNTTTGEQTRWSNRLSALAPNLNVRVVLGGASRAHSVYEGLQAFTHDSDKLLIHDGVRPLVRREEVLQTLAMCEPPYSGAVNALPVRDTLKKVGPDGVIETTVPRDNVWAMLTPQVFFTQDLRRAYEQYFQNEPQNATDDAQVMEAAGFSVRVVQGHPQNIKITYPEDLTWVSSQWENQT